MESAPVLDFISVGPIYCLLSRAVMLMVSWMKYIQINTCTNINETSTQTD